MIIKCSGLTTIETKTIPSVSQGRKILQLSIHDTINCKIANMNVAQLDVLIRELEMKRIEISQS